MRKILLLLGALILTSNLQAQEITKQEKGYFNLTEIGYFISQNSLTRLSNNTNYKNDAYAHSIRNINGLFINPKVSLGLGVGLDGYTFSNNNFRFDNTFLVFADSRYYFKEAKSTFFTYGDLGSSIAIDDNIAKGLMLNLGLGYKFKVANRTALNATMGYNHQNINPTSTFKQRYSSLSLRVGLLL